MTDPYELRIHSELFEQGSINLRDAISYIVDGLSRLHESPAHAPDTLYWAQPYPREREVPWTGEERVELRYDDGSGK